MSSDEDEPDFQFHDSRNARRARKQVEQTLAALSSVPQPKLVTDLSVLPDLNAIYPASSNKVARLTASTSESSSSGPAQLPIAVPAATPSSGFAASVPFCFGPMSVVPSSTPAAAAPSAADAAPTSGFSSSIPFSFAAAAPPPSSSAQPTAPVSSGFSSSVPFSPAPAATAASNPATQLSSTAPSGFASTIPFSFAAVTPASVPAPLTNASLSTTTPKPSSGGTWLSNASFDPAALSHASFVFPSSLISAAPKPATLPKDEAAALMRELRQRSLHTKEEKSPAFSSELLAAPAAAAEAAAAAASSDSAKPPVPPMFGLPALAAAPAPTPAAAPVVWSVPGGQWSGASLPSFASVPVGPVKRTLPIATAPASAPLLPAFDPSSIAQPKTTFGFSFASVDPSKFAVLAAAATGAFAPRQLPRADGRPLDVYKDILVSIFRLLNFADLHWVMAACKEWQNIALSMNPLKLTLKPDRLTLVANRLPLSRLAARHMGHLTLPLVSEIDLNAIVARMNSLQTLHVTIRPNIGPHAPLVLPRTLRELRITLQSEVGHAALNPDVLSCLANLPELTDLLVAGVSFPIAWLKGAHSLTSLSIPDLPASEVESLRALSSLTSLQLHHSRPYQSVTPTEVILAVFAAPNPFASLSTLELGPKHWADLALIYRRVPTLQTVRWSHTLDQHVPFDYPMLYSLPRVRTFAMYWITPPELFMDALAQSDQTASHQRDAAAMIAPLQSLRHLRILSLDGHPQLTTADLSAMLSSMNQLEELTLADLPRVDTLRFLVSPSAPFVQTLRRLRLEHCPLLRTVAELTHLRGLSSLQQLLIRGLRLMDSDARIALEDGVLLPRLPFFRVFPAENVLGLYDTAPSL